MFRKLKDKLEVEVRHATHRLPTSLQSTFGGSQSLSDVQENISGEASANDDASVDEEKQSPEHNPKPLEAASFETVDLSDLLTSTPNSDDGKVSASAPRESFFQSDVESASEVEDYSINLEIIPKEQIFQSFQKAKSRYLKYRNRYGEVVRAYRDLEQKQKTLEITLSKTQDVSLRKIGELREEFALEKQAKADMEENFNMMLGEKDCKINALQTQVKLLKDRFGGDLLKFDGATAPLIDWNSSLGSEGASITKEGEDDMVSIHRDLLPHHGAETALMQEDGSFLMKEELNESKVSLEEKSLQISHLLEERAFICNQLAEMKELLKHHDPEKIQTNDIKENLLQELSLLKSGLKTALDENKGLHCELSNQKKSLRAIEDDFREKVAAFAIRTQELQQLLEQSNLKINNSEQEIQAFKAIVESSKMNNERLTTDLEKYHAFIGSLNTLVESQQSLLTFAESETELDCTELHNRVQGIVASLESSRKSIEEFEHAKASLLLKMRNERLEFKEQLSDRDEEIRKCRHEHSMIEEKFQSVTNDKNSVLLELCCVQRLSAEEKEANAQHITNLQGQLAAKEQKVKELNSQVIHRDEQMMEWQMCHEKTESKILSLENDLSESLGQRLTLEDSIKATKAELDKQVKFLTGENDVLHKRLLDTEESGKSLAATGDEVEKLQKSLQKAEDNYQVLSIVVQDLERECEDNRQNVVAMQQKFVVELEDVRREKSEVEEMASKEIENLKAFVRSQQETLLANKNSYDTALHDVNQVMATELQAAKNCETILSSELDVVRRELDTMKQQQTREVSKLSEEVEKLLAENHSLDESNATLMSEIAQIGQKAEKDVELLKTTLQEKELMLISVNEEHTKCQSMLNQIMCDIFQERESEESSCNSIERIKAKLAELQSACGQSLQEKNVLISELEQCREELAAKQLEVKQLKETHVGQLRDVRDQTSNTISALKKKVQKFKADNSTEQSSLHALETQVEQYKLDIAGYQEKLKVATETLQVKDAELLQDQELAKKQLEQELNRRIQDYKHESEDLTSQVNSLKDQLNLANQELEFATQQLLKTAELEEKLKFAEQEIANSSQTMGETEVGWKNKFDEMERELNDKLQGVIEANTKQIKEFESRIESCLIEKHGAEMKVTDMTQTLLSLEEEISALKIQRDETSTTFNDKLQEVTEEHAEQIKMFESRVESCLNEKHDAEQKIADMTQKFLSLEEEMSVLKSQRDETSTTLNDKLQTVTEEHAKHIKVFESRVESCLNEKHDAEQKIADMAQKLLSLEEEMFVLKSQRDETSAALNDKVQYVTEEHAKQMKMFESRVEGCLNEKHNAEQKVNDMTQVLMNLEEELSALKNQRDEIGTALDGEILKYKDLAEKHQVLNTENTRKQDALEELQAIVEHLKKEKVLVKNDLMKCQEDRDEQLSALQKELEEKVAFVETTRKDYSEATLSLQDSLQCASHDSQMQNEKIDELERNLLTLRTQHDALTKHCEKLKSLVSKKEAQFLAHAEAKSGDYVQKIADMQREYEESVKILTKKHEDEALLKTNQLKEVYEAQISHMKEEVLQETRAKTSQVEAKLEACQEESLHLQQLQDQFKNESERLSSELKHKEEEIIELKCKLSEYDSRESQLCALETESKEIVFKDVSNDVLLMNAEHKIPQDNQNGVSASNPTAEFEYKQKLLIMEQEHSDKLKQLVKNFSVQLQEKEQEFQDMLSKITEKSQLGQTQMHMEHEASVRQLHQELFAKEATLDRLHEEYDIEKREKDDEFSSRLSQLEDQITSMQQLHDVQLQKLESNWKLALQKQIEEHSRHHSEQVKDLTIQWEQDRKNLEEQNRLSLAAVESSSETNELLRIQVVTQSNQLTELKKQHNVEMSTLGLACSRVQDNSNGQCEANDLKVVDNLREPTQIKYLRNVLFEYMMGKQTPTLAKVIATIFNFTEEETRQILQQEDRRTMLPQFLT